MALADVYDALRSRRVYKPALSHAAAVEVIHARLRGPVRSRPPARVRGAQAQFEQTFRELPD